MDSRISVLDIIGDARKCQQFKRIYDEHKIPFDVRYHLDDFLGPISWDGLLNHDSRKQHASDILQEVIKRLETKLESDKLSFLEKMNLAESKVRIRTDYQSQPIQFLEVMRDCFNEESCLRMTNSREDRDGNSDIDIELLEYKRIEGKIREVENKIKDNNQIVDGLMECYHSTLDIKVPRISDINENQQELNRKCEELHDHRQKEKCILAIEEAKKEIEDIARDITTQKEVLKQRILDGCLMVRTALEIHIWPAIEKYILQQKHAVCFLGKPPEGAVDSLNTICRIGGTHLMAHIRYIEMALSHIKRVNFQNDHLLDFFIRMRADMTSILERHMQNILIFTRQPQNVIKIVQNKSPHLHMCVTFLGADSLGIAHTLPSVTIRVYAENKLSAALNGAHPTNGVCKTVENGTDVQMVLKKPKNHMQANLNNVVLRGVERLEKKDKEDRVTEYKYGVVCFTEVSVRNTKYALKAISLPVILTSQTSQEGAAKGILLWHAAFSTVQPKAAYEDHQQVKWEEMKKVLKGMFLETGREIDDEQLDYIRRFILCQGRRDDAQNVTDLTKERFLREKIRGCDFTYWMWLYACKNLITDCVRTEWKDKLIYGFIGRSEADEKLKDTEPGTFLLRFRERKLQESQKANKCAYLAVAVSVYDHITRQKKVDHVKDFLTPTDITKHGLAQILKAMIDSTSREPLLQKIYPDRNFQEVLETYLPDNGDSSEGYRPTEFMIGVVNVPPAGTSECSDFPLSPLSTTNPTTPASVQSEAMPVDFFQNENIDNLLSNFGLMGSDPTEFPILDIGDGSLLDTNNLLCLNVGNEVDVSTTSTTIIPTTVEDFANINVVEGSPTPPPKRRASRTKSKGMKTQPN